LEKDKSTRKSAISGNADIVAVSARSGCGKAQCHGRATREQGRFECVTHMISSREIDFGRIVASVSILLSAFDRRL
jgi:hypothetical protein